MPPMPDDITEALAGYLPDCRFPAEPPRAVVCGVSGGADSAALLALTRIWAAPLDVGVVAVHVDHGIRPGSHVEADRVRELCGLLGAGFKTATVVVPEGSNLEARARDARHAVLGPNTFLGHTADDQAETVMLHLMRGGALDALAAMRSDRRPLLGLRRSDTEAVCEAIGYEPFMDPSNNDPRFLRNRVRHELLPLMDDISSRDVTPLLARASSLAAEDSDVLTELAAAIDPTDAKALRDAPVALARRAIREWLRDGVPPDAAAVDRVLGVALGEMSSTQVMGSRTVRRTRGRLRVEPTVVRRK